MHGEVCIFLPACVFIHNSLSKCYSSERLCVCYHLCKTSTCLLGVCDKPFGPHGAAEPTCADIEAADIWPGHTDTRTKGWCKLWPYFSQSKPHLCKHRNPTVLYFLFLSPFLSLSLVGQESSDGKSVFEEQICTKTWSPDNAYWLQNRL